MDTEAYEYTVAIGQQVRAEAGARKIPIARLAREMDMDRSTLIRYLDGKREFPISVLYRASAIIGVEANEILRLAGERMKRK